ncbi:hydroxyisourate hydrolase [Rhodanobacter glycinis]|jgi:5-hydroxyisourate hydrolase|uniref:5-hydroxyisourate hydrolase n=1 Tax=Rhodanobacter glycinis TaxID=582702 RepID=A0A1I4DJ05_9GAMM|nr:hydroxyisourate hydrolase [Rhodanobacter glycinis]SFK93063.1 5-hydroxyisourate hydrolase [Rhodanobacter glycinis]HWU77337.1 hydroxyisourate hydrolase [Rhodanobacter sp.]
MKAMSFVIATAGLLSLAPAHAAKPANPVSVHVLNMQDGLPAPGVEVILERMDTPGKWDKLADMHTNAQGRINALYPAGQPLQQGTYRVIFETGDWYHAHGKQSFFPQIPVVFAIDGSLPHYHVPLLLSPYGYSVYRGN